ncbi:hypothetical protein [Sphingorhabdus sp. 109]|jgi:hypothetical protein|uniref:hypothetical protein n=1 Tax=Sphingorhabdus sp. 109 TaxID=2653173 RepID=UPI0012F0F16D|nr:hypothetical protein [Sphingorhabdus sp. 109]VWX61305.1 conserved hypothetical protein [Sphingorhabdus sp. 109]
MSILGLVIIGVIFWPWLGNPSDFVKWEDRFRTSIPIALILGQPCETQEGNAIIRDTGPECYHFSAAREYNGVWLYEFEGSTFVEGADSAPEQRPKDERSAWLRYDPPMELAGKYDEQKKCYTVSAFRIRFIGRERQGRGGHMGLWNKVVLPTQMIKLEPLPSPDCSTY